MHRSKMLFLFMAERRATIPPPQIRQVVSPHTSGSQVCNMYLHLTMQEQTLPLPKHKLELFLCFLVAKTGWTFFFLCRIKTEKKNLSGNLYDIKP